VLFDSNASGGVGERPKEDELGVETGIGEVKMARKNLVKEVEQELARLDDLKDQAWERLGHHFGVFVVRVFVVVAACVGS
jgi:hypothetical protein